jgi:hypothetical protein
MINGKLPRLRPVKYTDIVNLDVFDRKLRSGYSFSGTYKPVLAKAILNSRKEWSSAPYRLKLKAQQ